MANVAPDSPAEQAAFAQRKLEKLYRSTHKALYKYKSGIELTQEVLVWKRPVAAVLLYAVIHWVFITYVQMNSSAVTHFGNFIFWLMVIDVLWRAACRPGEGGVGGEGVKGEGVRERRGGRSRTPSLSSAVPSFEVVLIQQHTPRESGQLPSFEVICIHIAEILMWSDNIWLALRHWSISEPLIFSAALAVPGVVLSLLGKYIPTVVLLYIIVMGLVTWPYIEFHSLRSKAVVFVQTQYPGALLKAQRLWALLKTLATSRGEDVPSELLLNEGTDERQTQQALQDAFDQATSNNPPSQQQQQQQQPQQQLRQRQQVQHRDHHHVDPGLSLLQDSVLGLPANAFHVSEMDSLVAGSLAPGPGEFPSISNLDQSLALNQFSSEVPTVKDVTPPAATMEEVFDDVTLPEHGSQDLDPFSDSIELDFGGYDFTDGSSTQPIGRFRARRTPRGHVINVTLAPSAPVLSDIPEEVGPSNPNPPNQGQFVGNFVPPPSYHSAITGADGGYSTSAPQQQEGYMGQAAGDLLGGEWSDIPKSSSTPVVEGSSGVGARRRHNT